MISDFPSNDSFSVKTGSRPTVMVDPSFDAEYPSNPKVVLVSDLLNLNFRFYRQKILLLWNVIVIELHCVYIIREDK